MCDPDSACEWVMWGEKFRSLQEFVHFFQVLDWLLFNTSFRYYLILPPSIRVPLRALYLTPPGDPSNPTNNTSIRRWFIQYFLVGCLPNECFFAWHENRNHLIIAGNRHWQRQHRCDIGPRGLCKEPLIWSLINYQSNISFMLLFHLKNAIYFHQNLWKLRNWSTCQVERLEAGHPGYFDDQEYEVGHHLFIIVLLSHNHHFIVLLVLFSMFGLSFNSKNKSEKMFGISLYFVEALLSKCCHHWI